MTLKLNQLPHFFPYALAHKVAHKVAYKAVFLGVALFSLVGCESLTRYVPSFISPHKVEIQQGNVITPEQVAQLKEGMTRDQVRFLLGTPLLTDVFHTNRWDYLFRLKKSDGGLENSTLTIFFDDNHLQRFVTTLPLPATETPVAATPTPEAATSSALQPIEAASGAIITPITPPVLEQKPAVATADAALPTAAAPVAATASTTSNINDTAALENLLESWRAAWETRNVEAYLSYYANSFQPQGMDRASWEAQRRERLSKPKHIKLKLQSLNLEQTSPENATASFTQVYASDLLREQGKKTLSLIKENGQWKIAAEQFKK